MQTSVYRFGVDFQARYESAVKLTSGPTEKVVSIRNTIPRRIKTQNEFINAWSPNDGANLNNVLLEGSHEE